MVVVASSSALSSSPPTSEEEGVSYHSCEDRLPDDVLLLVFARLACGGDADACGGATEVNGALPSSSAAASAAAASASSAAFVWLRTTLPLVSKRWRGLLAGPSPVWRHVVIDIGAEVAAAAAAARRRAAAPVACPSSRASRQLARRVPDARGATATTTAGL